MRSSLRENLTTPKREDLGLVQIENRAGLRVSALPSGSIFSIEHVADHRVIMINQVLGSPVAGGMTGVFLRLFASESRVHSLLAGPSCSAFGAGADRIVWEGEAGSAQWRLSLCLHADAPQWLWRLRVRNGGASALGCDATLVQDLGLGDPGYIMNNEAYASHYLDHRVETAADMGPVILTRQNLSQSGAHPWVAHGCVEGASGFATDFRQIVGPSGRDEDIADRLLSEAPSAVQQYETGGAIIRSLRRTLAPGAEAAWTFFGSYKPDHPSPSGVVDLALLSMVEEQARTFQDSNVAMRPPARTLLHDARPLAGDALEPREVARRYPRRTLEETAGARLSFFTPGRTHKRHVVLAEKERRVARRHGAIMRSGAAMLPSEDAMSVTCWMHGVFAAQLTIGNTSFHKLFSVSRDPWNITHHSGLRMLAQIDGEWRLLATPSAFEMGLNDCRWIYRLGARTIEVHAIVAGGEPAASWRISVEGKPCRLLIFGQIVLGDQEYASGGAIEIDANRKRASFRPESGGRWGRQYPQAAYHLVAAAPKSVEAMGGDELLYADGGRRGGGYVAIRTRPVRQFAFAVVGSLKDSRQAAALAQRYARAVDETSMLAASDAFWRRMLRGVRVTSPKRTPEVEALDAVLPWFAHDAIVHLTVPHGLEQYTGAAWGTRDVCQGPLELLLTLRHDEPAKEILRILFAQQYEHDGGWPQWFMLEPYCDVQSKEAHGDVIVWPLKALCDYIEATGDFAFLAETIAWRREDNFQKTERLDSIAAHLDKLIAAVEERFLPGTHLIRYGAGDWNDSLQPVDLERRDWMVSAWTVALLYEQLARYAEILRRAGDAARAKTTAALAKEMRRDFNTHLIRDGVAVGYAVANPATKAFEQILLHPEDHETGVHYSLIPMTQAIIGGAFTAVQTRHHRKLIASHLLFPDGARLMDKPIRYLGGQQKIFQRAESSAFFGREIGLMYVHSHLRYAEAMAVCGESQALWDALLTVNPIAAAQRISNAALRQRNAFFSSSDAAFPDRYAADSQWARVRDSTIPVEGGWRIYSSGPGLYINILIQRLFGKRRLFGESVEVACLPASKKDVRLVWRVVDKRTRSRRSSL